VAAGSEDDGRGENESTTRPCKRTKVFAEELYPENRSKGRFDVQKDARARCWNVVDAPVPKDRGGCSARQATDGERCPRRCADMSDRWQRDFAGEPRIGQGRTECRDRQHGGAGENGVRRDHRCAVGKHQFFAQQNPREGGTQGEYDEQIPFQRRAIAEVRSVMTTEDDEGGADGGGNQGAPAEDIKPFAGKDRRCNAEKDGHGSDHQRSMADGSQREAVKLDQKLDGDAKKGRNEEDAELVCSEAFAAGDCHGQDAQGREQKPVKDHGLYVHLIEGETAEEEAGAPQAAGEGAGTVAEEGCATGFYGQIHSSVYSRIREESLRWTESLPDQREYSSMRKGLVNRENGMRTGLILFLMGMLGWLCPAVSGLKPSRHMKVDGGNSPPTSGPGASQPPAITIPVEPLGFYAPGPFYLGQRETLVSLDFVDENRLLFTFRAPGLLHRTVGEETERQIRAVVLGLPQGNVEDEAVWTLHDYDRYLWMLHDGHFLLRDENTVKEGNEKLELTPLLQFPGELLSLEMDPGQQYLVTNSVEPSTTKPLAGQVDSSKSADAAVSGDGQPDTGRRDIVLRILRRASGQVMLLSRVRTHVHLPINSDGYLETLPGAKDWVLALNFFRGGTDVLGHVESQCQPPVQFVSHDEAVVNTCTPDGRRLIAMSIEGRELWEAASPETQIWPILVMGPDGTRLARETLTVDHAIDGFGHPLDPQDIKGQLVEVYDAVGGRLLLQATANPVLDGGGNVAISPSGRRVAILSGGAIQVYELAPPVGAAPKR
jgi:hypothetical protein